MGMEAQPGQASCVTAWTKVRAQILWGQKKEESVGQIPIEGEIPLGEWLNRVRHGSIS